MPESPTARHGLEPVIDTLPGIREGTRLTVRLLSGRGFLGLRGDGSDGAFSAAVEDVLQQALPRVANTFTGGASRVYWLGPDEWLIAAPQPRVAALSVELRHAVAERHASVNDLGGGLVGLVLAGGAAATVLAKGCTLDLHPAAFVPGTCAQSGVGKANVLLARDDDGFEIAVRRSFAAYLLQWLNRSGKPFGIGFGTAESR